MISAAEVISDVMDQVGAPSTLEPQMIKWVRKGIMDIGVAIEWTALKEKTIYIDDGRIFFPEDMITPWAVFGCTGGKMYELAYVGRIPMQAFANCCPFYDREGIMPDYWIKKSNDHWFFPNGNNGDIFDSVSVVYIALPHDEEGYPLMPDKYENAIFTYLELMYANRLRWRDRASVPESEIRERKDEWRSAKIAAYSRIKMPDKMKLTRMVLENHAVNVRAPWALKS